MILILSDEHDLSTNDVIDWISYYGFKFIRINDSSEISLDGFELCNDKVHWSLTVDKRKINSDDILNYWYRRGEILIDFDDYNKNDDIKIGVNRHLKSEAKTINNLIDGCLDEIKLRVGSFSHNFINKLRVLKKASDCGLDTPESIITTFKSRVIDFSKRHSFLITKAIDQGIALKVDDLQINGYTNVITQHDIEQLNNSFFPTLFQEGLKKKWEIRAFYLDGSCYSSAIFSQNDENTKIDFRHYGTKFPNRTPPYKLPCNIEKKIINLMQSLKMASGSIDLVYTTDNRYVFLEVNPVGQFAQVSDPCNYFLEEKVAKSLINEK